MKINAIPVKKETELNFQKLMDMVQPDDSLLLLMYGSPDPDAIASAMALREIFSGQGTFQKRFCFHGTAGPSAKKSSWCPVCS